MESSISVTLTCGQQETAIRQAASVAAEMATDMAYAGLEEMGQRLMDFMGGE